MTIFSFLWALIAAVFIVQERFFLGGLCLMVSGFFDLVDGAVARSTNRVSSFGGVLDSVLDRYSDLLVTIAIAVSFIRKGDQFLAAVSLIAVMGVAIIPYVKARANAEGITCEVGILERAERIILLLVGLMVDLLSLTMIVMAVLSHVTVMQRVLHVKRFLTR
ncbi:MAG: CDP-alcohol phosphatidyltransferase family protein [Syntrophales bacterium]|nr:CDP-alcohol phosphatidyltransferase family protein [Syntrophales bacterium]